MRSTPPSPAPPIPVMWENGAVVANNLLVNGRVPYSRPYLSQNYPPVCPLVFAPPHYFLACIWVVSGSNRDCHVKWGCPCLVAPPNRRVAHGCVMRCLVLMMEKASPDSRRGVPGDVPVQPECGIVCGGRRPEDRVQLALRRDRPQGRRPGQAAHNGQEQVKKTEG